VLILVADIRIRGGQLTFPVTLPENPRNCASQLQLNQFFGFVCDIAAMTIVKARDLWKYLKEKTRFIEE